MLTANELAQLRADILETLVDTCDIYRLAAAVDGDYFAGESATAVATGVACRVDPYTNRSDLEGLIGEREAARSYFLVSLPWDAHIQNGDYVLFEGARLDVLQLYGMHSARAVTRVIAVKVEGY